MRTQAFWGYIYVESLLLYAVLHLCFGKLELKSDKLPFGPVAHPESFGHLNETAFNVVA